MEKKAQIGIGVIITIAIAIIVGLILFQPIASNVEIGTRANSGVVSANTSITATQNVNYELTGQELVSVIAVINATGDIVVPASNYTVTECVRTSDNLKGICYKGLGVYNTLGTGGSGAVKVAYTYYPAGYIDDAGGRAISGIIILLTAIGIAIVVLAGSKFDFY